MNAVEAFLVLVGNVVVLTYLLPLGLFIYYYVFSGRSPWRSTELGKALAYQKASFTAVILLILASIFFPDYMGRGIVRIVVYTAVGISLWIDFGNLIRYQRIGRRNRLSEQKFLVDEQTKPRNPYKRK